MFTKLQLFILGSASFLQNQLKEEDIGTDVDISKYLTNNMSVN